MRLLLVFDLLSISWKQNHLWLVEQEKPGSKPVPWEQKMVGKLHLIVFFLFSLAVFFVPLADAGQSERPLWLRYPTISPDGESIAFTYGGQIWMVSSNGGEAVPLTGEHYHSKRPVWSPEGEHIAFAANVFGNYDVFVMSAKGGDIQRLTFHSTENLPYAFSHDGKQVYFSSVRPGPHQADFYSGSPLMSQKLYSVPVSGGRPCMVLPLPALDIRFDSEGTRMLYTNLPSFEQPWRKHHVSDATRDIWLYDAQEQTHEQLTFYRGEDRNPLWSLEQDYFYYLSQRSGSFNVWKKPLSGNVDPVQVTFHDTHPVRFLTKDNDGGLVYGYDGEIWRLPPGNSDPVRVPVRINKGHLKNHRVYGDVHQEATELAVSPNGRELAVVAKGDIFVVSTETGRTRRITSTPQQERSVSFSPDGRALLYAGERDGNWDIFETRIIDEEAMFFTGGTRTREKKVLDTASDVFEPAYSPDGSRIAFMEDRSRLMVLDRESGKTTAIMPEGLFYSYVDADMNFITWSPDGGSLLAAKGCIVSRQDVVLLDASGKLPMINLSRSGYIDRTPIFTADGKAVLWASDRRGFRSAERQHAEKDVFGVFLDKEAFDVFMLDPELVQQGIHEHPATEHLDGPDGAAPTFFEESDLEGLNHRTIRMTPFSLKGVSFFDTITPDNRHLLVVAKQSDGMDAGYIFSQRGEVEQLFIRPASPDYALGPEKRDLYFFDPEGIVSFNLETGEYGMLPFEAEVAYDFRGEVNYIFNHVWRLTSTKFYDPEMHGVDWEKYKDEYSKYLPHIHTWEDFTEMLSEMVGELNASHTGARLHATPPCADRTASLGIYYDHSHREAGVKVAEILPGGPADRAHGLLKPGALIKSVDGREITPDMDIHELLNRKEGVPISLEVLLPGSAATVHATVVPDSFEHEMHLAYMRWVSVRKAMTDELSNKRIGYIHFSSMDAPSFQRAYSELFGEYRDREAVIVDVRFNMGGNLHEELITLFTGKALGKNISRDGFVVGQIPRYRWIRPSAMLVNAASYSDGSILPHLYQKHAVGPLVGDRVPGTGTASWRGEQQMSALTYGVPQLGFQGPDGAWFENQEIEPDVLVRNSPDSVTEGRDLQLEKAVQVLLDKLNDR